MNGQFDASRLKDGFNASWLKCSRNWILPPTGGVNCRWSKNTMPVVAITSFCDQDNFVLGDYPATWVPPSTTAMQYFERLWTLYDQADYTYTGKGDAGGLTDGGRYVAWLHAFTGTFTITSSLTGTGRCPTVNDYPYAFKYTDTDMGYTVTNPLYPGDEQEVWKSTVEPDFLNTGPDIVVGYPGFHNGIFDHFRGLVGGSGAMPNGTGEVYSWSSPGFTYSGGNSGSYDGKMANGDVAWEYTLELSNPTDVDGLYDRAYGDFVALNPWPTLWADSPTRQSYNMAPSPLAGYDPGTYDGSLQLSYAASFDNPVPPGFDASPEWSVSGFSGYDLSAISVDAGTIVHYRAQILLSDAQPHYYWIGNIKWNNSAGAGWTNSPGTWKFRISFVRDGWISPATGETESRLEVDFPGRGWPISSVGDAPITTEYNFIIVDEEPETWLARFAAAFPSGFGDYYF